jgi:hypothetical protein
MPRPTRHKLSLSKDSIEKHLNENYALLEQLKATAIKHYNYVLKLIEELGSDPDEPAKLMLMAQLEQSRNNSLKAFEGYVTKKKELLNLHVVATKNYDDLEFKKSTKKGLAKEEDASLSITDIDNMEKMEEMVAKLMNLNKDIKS